MRLLSEEAKALVDLRLAEHLRSLGLAQQLLLQAAPQISKGDCRGRATSPLAAPPADPQGSHSSVHTICLIQVCG